MVVRSRMRADMDRLALHFTSSMDADERIFYYDLLVDMAHVLGLLKSGLIGFRDAREIIGALMEIMEEGYGSIPKDYEDVHEAIEAEVTRRTEAGKRMHTARSRNDEVATCLRMYARDKLISIAYSIIELRKIILRIARENVDVLMPGFTHLQYAQPTRLSHHLLAHHDAFQRDFERIMQAFRRVNLCPLGSAAFAGTSFELDRYYTAELLGFDGVVENSCDAVSSRDFLIESVFVASNLLLNLSRLAEEIVLWSSEFGFVELPDEFSSSSSIMPQKKNPDVAEIIRAKAGKAIGSTSAVMSIYKALPMTYNRDFQEMNGIMFEVLEEADISAILMAKMLESIRFKPEVMREKALKGYSDATEYVDELVRSGVPFRDAHRIVGRAVSENRLSPERVEEIAREMGYEVSLKGFRPDLERAVERKSLGGTGRNEVIRMIEERTLRLERDIAELNYVFSTVRRRVDHLLSEALRVLRGDGFGASGEEGKDKGEG